MDWNVLGWGIMAVLAVLYILRRRRRVAHEG